MGDAKPAVRQYQYFGARRAQYDVGVVVDQPGIRLDARGYAVVPYAATIYRQNRMALDVNAMADDVDIDDAVTRVVPETERRAGSGQL